MALAAKPEIGAAAAVILLAALARSKDPRSERRRTFPILGAALLGAIGAYGVAFAGIPLRLLFPEGPLVIFSPPKEWRNVYRLMSGLADPAAAVNVIATALFLDLLILAMIAALLWLAAARRAGQVAVSVGVLATVLCFSTPAGAGIEKRLPPLLSPLPVLSALAALLILRTPLDSIRRARFLLFGFSGAVASRVLFGLVYGRITTPYSILVFPGLAACAAILVMDLLPERFTMPKGWAGAVAVLCLSLSLFAAARWKNLQPRSRVIALRTAAGTLRLPGEKAIPIAQTLEFLARHARAEEGVSGFPEIGFFNFVTGLRNPLREEQVVPGHLNAVEERRVIERLETEGPRFLLLVNQPTTAFGPAAFGRDYAVALWKAVEKRYRLVASFGSAPPEDTVGAPGFFLRIYERLGPGSSGGGEPGGIQPDRTGG